MSIKITLRTSGSASPFRDYLLALAGSTSGDELVLCSGYFAQKVSADRLAGAIKGNSSLAKVQIYGHHGVGTDFLSFARDIKSAHLATSAFEQAANPNKWHAKVALLLKAGEPLAGIIGSSNLTQPAYRAPASYWNYECDVVIDPHDILNVDVGAGSVIQAILDPTVQQPDELARLKELLDEVQNQAWSQVV